MHVRIVSHSDCSPRDDRRAFFSRLHAVVRQPLQPPLWE